MNTEDSKKPVLSAGDQADVPPSHAALPNGSVLQEFEVTGVVGEGGFGIVYLAQDRQLQRVVAIKEYMPASLASRGDGKSVVVRSERYQDTFAAGLKSFISEARMLAQFKHPALVEVFRFWEQNGTVYMAMPFYRGKTLREVLKGGVVADERWLKALLGPLMDALEMMHEQSVYHRDIAPDNILVLSSGAPVLLDLGAARRIITDLTQAVTVVLKPGYAPIEQYAEDTSVQQGPWTDIYALAAVVYFAIVGRAPVASVSRIMKDSLQPLSAEDHPGFSETFLAAINHALAVKPEDRPQSIAEFRESLGVESFVVPTTMFSYRGELAPSTSRPDPDAPGGKDLLPAPAVEPLPDTVPDEQRATAQKSDFSSTANHDKPEQHSLAADSAGGASAESSAPAGSLENAWKLPETQPIVLDTTEAVTSTDPDATVLPLDVDSSAQIPGSEEQVIPPAQVRSHRRIWLAGATALVLVGVGTALFWSQLPEAAGTALAAQSSPQSSASQSAATPSPVVETAASEPSANPSSPGEEASRQSAPVTEQAGDTRSVGTTEPEAGDKPDGDKVAPLAPVKLKVVLQPWGEVWVDGVSRGPSPPLKELTLPEGEHRIELRNPGFNSVTRKVTLKKGEPAVIEHFFR